jgi:hypothetical protein
MSEFQALKSSGLDLGSAKGQPAPLYLVDRGGVQL